MATTIKKSRKKSQPKCVPTLLQAIERVVELSKDSKMSETFMLHASPEIGLLADSFGITERQAVLFCVCMENIARHYSIDTILHGTCDDMLPMLIRHCDNERLDELDSRKIGF